MNNSNIHIFGGARGIGEWFAKKVFMNHCKKVIIYDIDIPKKTSFPSEIITIEVKYENGKLNGCNFFEEEDIIVLSVPIHSLQEITQALFPVLPAGCLIIDMSSVKVKPISILKKNSDNLPISVLGVHPLFGPSVNSPIGQTIVLADFEPSEEKHRNAENFFSQRGLILKKASSSEHDEAMKYVQVLTHFSYLVFSAVISKNKRLSDLMDFRTPPFTILMAFAGRILGSPHTTYVNIQKYLENAKEIRRSFIAVANELASAFADEKSLQDGLNFLQHVVEPFDGAEIAECREISAKAIESLQNFEKELFTNKSQSLLCGLVRIDTKEPVVHIGIVKAISPDRIVFEERSKAVRFGVNGEIRYAICSDISMKTSFKRFGIRFDKFKEIELMKRHFRIMSSAELKEWLNMHCVISVDHINIFAPMILTEQFYEKWLPQFIPEIIKVDFLELYKRKGKECKITLKITYKYIIDISSIRSRIQEFINDFTAQQSLPADACTARN